MTVSGNKGFSLVEILVGLAVASVLATAVYGIFSVQHRIYLAQKQIADLQQNLRTCMYLLEEDIKHACFDPTGSARPTILHADRGTFRFQADLNENGHRFNADPEEDDLAAMSGSDPNETLGFRLGLTEKQGVRSLIREVWGGSQRMADHIEALDFAYLDSDGTPLAQFPLSREDREKIRAVEVTLVTRSPRPCRGRIDPAQYRNLRGDILVSGKGDTYQRRAFSKIIHLRNRSSS